MDKKGLRIISENMIILILVILVIIFFLFITKDKLGIIFG